MQDKSEKNGAVCINKKPDLIENEVTFHWWPNEDTSLHSHEYFEFFIVTGNAALHELNAEKQELPCGILRMIKPTDCHRFIKSEGFSCVHMNFCVTKERLEKICCALKFPLNLLEEIKEPQIKLSSEELTLFSEKARALNLMLTANHDYADVLICELVSHAVSLILNKKIFAQFNYPGWFAELIEKIHSAENIDVSVPEVYEMGGFSPPVMIKYFKKYTGKTVKAYLRDMKCERACILLGTTRLSTLEISTALGYDSLSHFNRIFKEYTGVSPGAYRNSFLK